MKNGNRKTYLKFSSYQIQFKNYKF